MAYVKDLPAPSLIYGTAWKEERTAALTELALRAGFRAIDTANQRRHYFEAGVGQALAASKIPRAEVFLQTKFTYRAGQDHRLPYDPAAPLSTQVAQSLASSLEHLGTDYVDSFLLHGPASSQLWTSHDSEVWTAMRKERDAGRTRSIGVSNVTLRQLQQMPETPAYVQNRCFARTGWDREVRAWCRDHGAVYQGFSLLTANPEVFPAIPAPTIFRYAQSIGILPLTGPSNPEHMRQDLATSTLALDPAAIEAIEALSRIS
jgi:diketogulonate reductase-like aldo/keto reductase